MNQGEDPKVAKEKSDREIKQLIAGFKNLPQDVDQKKQAWNDRKVRVYGDDEERKDNPGKSLLWKTRKADCFRFSLDNA